MKPGLVGPGSFVDKLLPIPNRSNDRFPDARTFMDMARKMGIEL
ncbi:hypothetical protein [Hymenobacter fastidiosus]